MLTITSISSCTTTACAFNHDGCNAYAITVGGEADATCTTFSTLDVRAGLSDAEGQVGACHRLDCTHNKDLMCSAASITIVGDAAKCADYSPR